MKFPKPKIGKKNEEESKPIVTQPLDSNENKEKNPANEEDDKKNAPKTFFFKRLVDKKLTIILIENTMEVAKEEETLIKIIKSLVSEGLVGIINYGSAVRQSEIFEVSAFGGITFLCNEDIGNAACLYDALVNLESLVSREYMSIKENEYERIKIKDIEVIGIGTCKDTCSKVLKEVAIDYFCRVTSKPGIITKYFCLTEETFVDAAEIGFHSIGAIFRSY